MIKTLDSSKLKEFAEDNFKCHENERNLSKQVENTVGKGEIARYEQFLLFPQCFQKVCFPGASKGVIVWEWVKYEIRVDWSFTYRKIASGKTFRRRPGCGPTEEACLCLAFRPCIRVVVENKVHN